MCRGSSLHLLSMMDLLRLLASVTPGTGWSCWPQMDTALALHRYELLLLRIPPECPDGNPTLFSIKKNGNPTSEKRELRVEMPFWFRGTLKRASLPIKINLISPSCFTGP